ncbi:MAG TPA: SPOR domain-containing protein [Steroidobacteraceae bacterium]|nr:SPOR domain-containing protein [Steroidobacteraceae bacterium]
MRRSITDSRLYRLAPFLLAALGARGAFAQLPVSGPARLVNVIEVNEREDQVDLTMVFNCSMRFITSLPASEGRQVHIQLAPMPDCGVSPLSQLAAETPPLSGGANIVAAARVDSMAPGQVTLTLDFRKSERFVIAQGVDPRGLRLRLIDRARGRGAVRVGQPTDAVSNFAINLESQPKPFTPTEVELAHQRLKAPAFVSEALVDGEKWYRLRVGPIERRAEAERLLSLALPDYARAWLAIGDDAVTSDPNAAVVPALPVERIGSDPPLAAEVLRTMLAEVRAAMAAHDYPRALALLTKLQRQPEFPDRARAQELLGLARERSGQLAHAKAEYEEYLRRYPQGEAAERVAFRLRILRAAEAKARTGREASGEAQGWQVSGGFGQMARYDNSRLSNGALPPNSQSVPTAPAITDNALFNDVDLLARRRGESYDWIGRLSAGYDKSFTQDQFALGSATRVSLASIEVLDRSLGLLGRLGRQASNANGILGTFDGLFLSWQFQPSWAVNAAAGYPVEQLILSPQTQERFETLALAYTPPNAHWDGSVFAATQTFQGVRDRDAVGFEARYLAARASLVTVVDYDTAYHSLNTASVLGTLQLPARWSVSFDAERRNSPVLTTRNALIGQTFTDLTQLEQVFTPAQIYQLARDRTPVTSNYSLTTTKPLGSRFQFTTIVSATETAAQPASGGVAAIPATGLLLTYQAQLYSSNLWHSGDFNVLTFTVGNTEIGRIDSISTTSRFPIGGAWRLGPRFSVNRLTSASDGSTATTYIPSMLLDYQRGNKLLQLDMGGELGKREAFLQLQNGAFVQTQNTTRYYVSVSYRISFQK